VTTLDILSCGAVTPVGLDAFQTAAAFRAGVAGFEGAIPLPPPQEPLRAARIPSRASLRRTPSAWLVNLAARGIREALSYRTLEGRLGIVMCFPEQARQYAGPDPNANTTLFRAILDAAGHRFERAIIAAEGGAGVASALELAAAMLSRREADACVVAGADSLLNATDIAALRASGRMLEPGNPRALIPGEAAGAFVVGLADRHRGAIARVLAVAAASEADAVIGGRLSQGRAFEAALQATSATVPEPDISFRVSTTNGEHYATWESMFFATRYYRTRRERLPVWYPASALGETGAASGVLTIILAAFGIAGGYAPGPYAMCEAASDTGLRAACVVGPAPGASVPPFRAEEGASSRILDTMHG